MAVGGGEVGVKRTLEPSAVEHGELWSNPGAVESRFGPKRGFGETPGELLTISKPNHYPKSEKPPRRKGFTKPNL